MKTGIRAHDIYADGFENVIKRFREMGFSQMQTCVGEKPC